jgi:methionyl-tRNA formyltransferase
MSNLSIALIGCNSLTEAAIDSLIRSKFKLNLIITKNDDKYNSDYVNLKKKYLKKVKVVTTKDINSKKILDKLWQNNINLIFCIGWSHILNKNILNFPKFGVIGHHPTMLPKNKGKHPFIWSIILNEKYFGSSFFLMNERIDDGKIYSQKKIRIFKKEISHDLIKKCQKAIKKQIIYICGNINKIKEIRKTNTSNYWRRRFDCDGKIDFRMTAASIDRLIRALTFPYVGAHILYEKKKYFIYRSKIIKTKLKTIPGKILKFSNNFLIVMTEENAIKIFSSKLAKKLKNKKYILCS